MNIWRTLKAGLNWVFPKPEQHKPVTPFALPDVSRYLRRHRVRCTHMHLTVRTKQQRVIRRYKRQQRMAVR